MSVLEKEFFVEQFRQLNDKIDHLSSGQERIREEMTIMREQVALVVTTIPALHNRLDLMEKRINRLEGRTGLNQPEH